MSTGKLFAIAYKGHSEIVRSRGRPKLVRSFLKRPYFDQWLGRSMNRRVPVISYEGDFEVLKQLSSRQMGNISGHTLRPGTIWELDKETAKKLALKEER